MKKFVTPEIEVEKFVIADVITTSDDISGEPCSIPELNLTEVNSLT